ncbi:MAG: response regulator [Candidatus Aureabacteria bacterium]|nr:response regulator [Candidatus Auribacterota bacterium]
MKSCITDSSILIIDDDKHVRDLLSEVFNNEKAKITLTNTGYDGFQALMNSHFDLVLMDLHMPEMDGFEAIKAIRQIDPIIPIIVISGYASDENIENCRMLGANDFIAKPFDLKYLVKRTNELIKEKLDTDKS